MSFLARFMLLMVLPLVALAVPNYINYQGRLLDNNGIPVTQSNMTMVVSIWTASTAGVKLYQENQTVNVDDGVYSFQIGNGTGGVPAWSPSSLFNTSAPRFIELSIQGQTLTPRHQILSAPFTLQSGNSDNLGGQPIGYFGTAAGENSLQNQINNLAGQLSALQGICEAAHGYWSGSACLPTIAVLPNSKGDDYYPVAAIQLHRVWIGDEQEILCLEPFYRAYPDVKGGILPVKTCNGAQVLEDPDPRGCGFGKESQIIYLDASKCDAYIKGGKG